MPKSLKAIRKDDGLERAVDLLEEASSFEPSGAAGRVSAD
jgi:hypothetical protein